MNTSNNRFKLKCAIIIILAIVLTMVPFYNIIIKGVYGWHVLQPQFWQGGLEVIGFMCMTFLLLLLSKKSEKPYNLKNKNGIILIIFGSVYLSMNGVIIPFVTVYLYFEALCFIGSVSCKGEDNIIINFISGVSVWSFFAIICSLLKSGTINDLRWLTVVLTLISAIMNKKPYILLPNKFLNYFNANKDLLSKFLNICIIFFFLALVAKTNTALDTDSLWYGLRPEYVLVGPNSFYDYLGYSAFVYYYPKLMELLFLPISGLKDYSFILTANIGILALLMVAFYNLCVNVKLLLNINKKFILAFCLFVFTVPAIANISVTAKPDILGCFLTFCAFMFFVESLECKRYKHFIYSLCCMALLTGTKLTYILWGGLVFIAILIVVIKKFISKDLYYNNFKPSNIGWNSYIICFFSFFAILGIHLRTLLLTGFPIYPTFINLFSKLGFSAKNLAKNKSISLSADFDTLKDLVINFLQRVYYMIFNPNSLGNVIMLWTSTIVVFMFVFVILHYRNIKSKKNDTELFFKICVVLFIISSIYYVATLPQLDGNYFILPTVCLCFILLYYLESLYSENSYTLKIITIFSVILFIFLNVPVMFVSHPAWVIGTKAFSKELMVNNFETSDSDLTWYKSGGYQNIANLLKMDYTKKRIISSPMGLHESGRIEAPIETFWEISSPYLSNEEMVINYEKFLTYLSYAKIQGFLVLNDDVSLFKEYVNRYVNEFGAVNTVKDEKAFFYEIDCPLFCNLTGKIKVKGEFGLSENIDWYGELETYMVIYANDENGIKKKLYSKKLEQQKSYKINEVFDTSQLTDKMWISIEHENENGYIDQNLKQDLDITKINLYPIK